MSILQERFSVVLLLLSVIILSLLFPSEVLAIKPSERNVFIGEPDSFGEFDAAGYTDWYLWGESVRHPYEYHEILSGEWAGAVYFDGIDTGLIDPNNPNSGKKAMWLTDHFLWPNWTTNSTFQVTQFNNSWDDSNNPVPANNTAFDHDMYSQYANDTGQTVISNGMLKITIDYEVVDLGQDVESGIDGSPLAFWVPDAGTPDDPEAGERVFVWSDRYVVLQTYSFTNIDPNDSTMHNVEFYQMLHGHPADLDTATITSTYHDVDYWPDALESYTPYNAVHQVGKFRYDITQWNDGEQNSNHGDWAGFSSVVEPNWIECGPFRGGHSYTENNKPSKPGTHWNIEERNLNGEIYEYDEVAGAMGWHLGSLDPNETTSITVAFMFGTGPIKTMADVYSPLRLEIEDDAGDCVSPCPSEKTLTIDYSYVWNIPGWEAYSYSPSDVNDLEMTCYLPAEVDFVSADPNEGRYDSGLHAYIWYIGDLTGGEEDSVDISVSINSSIIPGGELISSVVAEYTVSGYEYSQETEYTTVVCECDCGSVIYVDEDATAGGDDGSSWGDAYLKLQDALAEADVCDEIWVAEGTYTPADSFSESATFALVNGVKVYGGFDGSEDYVYERNWADNETVLSGFFDPNEVDFVVTADSDVRWAILDGFTIERGAFAGVYCEGGSVHIEHNEVKDCGIGIYCYETESPIIRNNIIYDNVIGMSFEDSQGVAVVRNSTIVDNDPIGVDLVSGVEPSIKNCIFWGHADANDLIGCYATYSCIESPTDFYDESDPNIYLGIGEGNIDDNPSFAVGSYRLSSTSPCIDVGEPNETYYHQRDIDKQFRVLFGRVDMGADEYYDCDYESDADFNDDGIVNFLDYGEFAAHWLETTSDPNWNSLYDLAGEDGAIDVNDLALFADEWLWMDCETMYDFPMEEQGGVDESYESMMMRSGFSAYAVEAVAVEPTLKERVDTAQEVIDWLEDLWKADKELRKNLDKQDWDAFMDKIYEWFYGVEDSYVEEQKYIMLE